MSNLTLGNSKLAEIEDILNSEYYTDAFQDMLENEPTSHDSLFNEYIITIKHKNFGHEVPKFIVTCMDKPAFFWAYMEYGRWNLKAIHELMFGVPLILKHYTEEERGEEKTELAFNFIKRVVDYSTMLNEDPSTRIEGIVMERSDYRAKLPAHVFMDIMYFSLTAVPPRSETFRLQGEFLDIFLKHGLVVDNFNKIIYAINIEKLVTETKRIDNLARVIKPNVRVPSIAFYRHFVEASNTFERWCKHFDQDIMIDIMLDLVSGFGANAKEKKRRQIPESIKQDILSPSSQDKKQQEEQSRFAFMSRRAQNPENRRGARGGAGPRGNPEDGAVEQNKDPNIPKVPRGNLWISMVFFMRQTIQKEQINKKTYQKYLRLLSYVIGISVNDFEYIITFRRDFDDNFTHALKYLNMDDVRVIFDPVMCGLLTINFSEFLPNFEVKKALIVKAFENVRFDEIDLIYPYLMGNSSVDTKEQRVEKLFFLIEVRALLKHNPQIRRSLNPLDRLIKKKIDRDFEGSLEELIVKKIFD